MSFAPSHQLIPQKNTRQSHYITSPISSPKASSSQKYNWTNREIDSSLAEGDFLSNETITRSDDSSESSPLEHTEHSDTLLSLHKLNQSLLETHSSSLKHSSPYHRISRPRKKNQTHTNANSLSQWNTNQQYAHDSDTELSLSSGLKSSRQQEKVLNLVPSRKLHTSHSSTSTRKRKLMPSTTPTPRKSTNSRNQKHSSDNDDSYLPAFMLAPKEDFKTNSKSADHSGQRLYSSRDTNQNSTDGRNLESLHIGRRQQQHSDNSSPSPVLAPQLNSSRSAAGKMPSPPTERPPSSLVQRRKRKNPHLSISSQKSHKHRSPLQQHNADRPKTSLGLGLNRGRSRVSRKKRSHSTQPASASTFVTTDNPPQTSAVSPMKLHTKPQVFATVLNYKSDPAQMSFEEISSVMERKLKRKTGYHSSEIDSHRLPICQEAFDVFIRKYGKFAYFLRTIKKEYDISLFHYEKLAAERLHTIDILNSEKGFLEENHRDSFDRMEKKYKALVTEIQTKLRKLTEQLESHSIQNRSLQRQNELLLRQLDRQRHKNSLLVELIRRTQDESTVNICVALMEQLENSTSSQDMEQVKKSFFDKQLPDFQNMQTAETAAPVLLRDEIPELPLENSNHKETAASPSKSIATQNHFDFASYKDCAVEALLVPGLSNNQFDWDSIIEHSCLPYELREILSHQSFEENIRELVSQYDRLYFKLEKIQRQKRVQVAQMLRGEQENTQQEQETKSSQQSALIQMPQYSTSTRLNELHNDVSHTNIASHLDPPDSLPNIEESSILNQNILPTRDFLMGNPHHNRKELRHVGKLKHHNFSRVEALKIITDVWSTKLSIDRNVPIESRSDPLEFLLLYLKKRCAAEMEKERRRNPVASQYAPTLEENILSYAYSLEYTCELYKHHDVDLAVFYRVIFENSLEQDVVMSMDKICRRLFVVVEQLMATQYQGKRVTRHQFMNILDEYFPMKNKEQLQSLCSTIEYMIDRGKEFDVWKLFEDYPNHPNYFLREIRRQLYLGRETTLYEIERGLVLTAETFSRKLDQQQGYIVSPQDCCDAVHDVHHGVSTRFIDFLLKLGFKCDRIEELGPDVQLQRRIYKATDKRVGLAEFVSRIGRVDLQPLYHL